MEQRPEVERLESLWGGDFGDRYTDRNATDFAYRREFWERIQRDYPFESALEVGCNLGGNLRWLRGRLFGVDVNLHALTRLRADLPHVNGVQSPARELPFRDRYFDLVYSAGVLIHQPDATLPLVMAEMVRCSARWVLMAEYSADEHTDVPYRGESGALIKRPYGRLFAELFPDWDLRGDGFLGRETGWDDVTWWAFERG